jgi:hypothetical protein
MKAKWNSPTLLVDDHHGIYMGKLAWEYLSERHKQQAKKHLSPATIESIQNTEDEWYYESCDRLCRIEFRTKTGGKFTLAYAEGGIWAIPNCFRGKKLEEFFGY